RRARTRAGTAVALRPMERRLYAADRGVRAGPHYMAPDVRDLRTAGARVGGRVLLVVPRRSADAPVRQRGRARTAAHARAKRRRREDPLAPDRRQRFDV